MQTLKKTFGTRTQISTSGTDLISTKELPIASYSNLVYSDINTNLKSVRNLVDVNISGIWAD